MKIEDRWVRLVMNVGDLPDESNARTILIELLSDEDFRDTVAESPWQGSEQLMGMLHDAGVPAAEYAAYLAARRAEDQ